MAAFDYDLLIIGTGPGGYVAAIRAAQLGLKTACIEKRDTFGGTCLNVGCIPSKALLQSSEHYAFLRKKGSTHGIDAKGIKLDFKQMMQRKSEVVEGLVNGVKGLLKRNKVDTFQGSASFVDPHTVAIAGNDEKKLSARYIIIATGSDSIALPFLPFDEKQVVSSTGALSLEKVPGKLIVIGAGVIGVELASVYCRLGSQVAVIEMLDHICPAMDRAIGRNLQQVLEKQGLEFHLKAQVTEAKKGKQVSLKFKTGGEEKSLAADVVLVAVGRRAYTAGLALEKAGIKTDGKGMIPVDSAFRTVTPHIFAIGDVIDGPMLAHKASEEGIAVAEILAGQKPHINYAAVPNVIYTHPEVAAVGLTEEEGKALGLHLILGSYPFRGNPRARCAGDVDGMVKVIGDKNSGRLIGLHIIGPHASEMIGEGVVAIEKGMTVAELAAASHAHPTLSEAIKEAALQALGRAIHL